MKKPFAIAPEKIKQLVPPMGRCFITDRVTVDGRNIGYMYRERSSTPEESGWCFFSGDESQDYLDDPEHTGLYEANTAANYDPDIIPYLKTRAPCAFEKVPGKHEYQRVEDPAGPDDSPLDEAELHPEFPIVEGRYELTEGWAANLPRQFNQRIEERQLVFWRPGVTVWTSVWDLNDGESPHDRYRLLKKMISPQAENLLEEVDGSILRFAYRLDEAAADSRRPAFYGFAVGPSGHVQMAVYFDDEGDLELATRIWRSLNEI
jgi:hypothetical protein